MILKNDVHDHLKYAIDVKNTCKSLKKETLEEMKYHPAFVSTLLEEHNNGFELLGY
jgi:hypothetical protein